MPEIWPWKNFTKAEMTCQCGCGGLPPHEFMARLQALRDSYGRPMKVTSGYRCPAHNEKVSSTGRAGPHTKGAADISVPIEDVPYFVRKALVFNVTGLGVKQHGSGRFIHIDWLEDAPGQPRPRIWSYP